MILTVASYFWQTPGRHFANVFYAVVPTQHDGEQHLCISLLMRKPRSRGKIPHPESPQGKGQVQSMSLTTVSYRFLPGSAIVPKCVHQFLVTYYFVTVIFVLCVKGLVYCKTFDLAQRKTFRA
jgi:hypothetical protein